MELSYAGCLIPYRKGVLVYEPAKAVHVEAENVVPGRGPVEGFRLDLRDVRGACRSKNKSRINHIPYRGIGQQPNIITVRE